MIGREKWSFLALFAPHKRSAKKENRRQSNNKHRHVKPVPASSSIGKRFCETTAFATTTTTTKATNFVTVDGNAIVFILASVCAEIYAMINVRYQKSANEKSNKKKQQTLFLLFCSSLFPAFDSHISSCHSNDKKKANKKSAEKRKQRKKWIQRSSKTLSTDTVGVAATNAFVSNKTLLFSTFIPSVETK